MHDIQGVPRQQQVLFHQCLDELVDENNPVRLIDAYVEKVDMKKVGFEMPELVTGAPPYRPQVLLKIYIYGYFERIRTSRRLEEECQRNKYLMWLTEGLAPDFKTLADFRRDNRVGIKNLFKEFLAFCQTMGLLSFKTVAIDGTKIRAQNSIQNIYKREELDAVRERIEKKIEEYLAQLDANDRAEEELALSGDAVKAVVEKLRKLKAVQSSVEEIRQVFAQDKDLAVYFATDPDSRYQNDKGQVRAGYNAQIATDADHKLIVVAEVTNDSNDLGQMTPMVSAVAAAKEALKIEGETDTVMDAGYCAEKEVLANKDHATIHIAVSDPREEARLRKHHEGKKKQPVPGVGFEVQNFTYDPEGDMYRCPAGQLLSRRLNETQREQSGREYMIYHCRACEACPKRPVCTRDKAGRTIKVSVNKAVMDAFKKEMNSDKNMRLRVQRKELVEHPFGTIKRTWGYSYFLQKGIDKVRAEFSLICFTYNFKRVLNLCGMEKMMAALA